MQRGTRRRKPLPRLHCSLIALKSQTATPATAATAAAAEEESRAKWGAALPAPISHPPSLPLPPEAFESIDHRQRDPLPFVPRTGVQGLLEIAGARVARDMEARKRGFFLFVVKKAISTSQPSINRDSSTATDGQLALGGRFTIEIPSEAAADFATRFTTSPRGTQPLTRSQLHRGLERGNGDWSLLFSSESTAT